MTSLRTKLSEAFTEEALKKVKWVQFLNHYSLEQAKKLTNLDLLENNLDLYDVIKYRDVFKVPESGTDNLTEVNPFSISLVNTLYLPFYPFTRKFKTMKIQKYNIK